MLASCNVRGGPALQVTKAGGAPRWLPAGKRAGESNSSSLRPGTADAYVMGMFSLRKKLILGSGGLLAVLLLVGGMGIVLITRYSTTVDQVLRENYASVDYGQEMKDALDLLQGLAHDSI